MFLPPSPPGADQAYAGYLAQTLVGPLADYLPPPCRLAESRHCKISEKFSNQTSAIHKQRFYQNVLQKRTCFSLSRNKKKNFFSLSRNKKGTFLAFPEKNLFASVDK